MGRRVVQLIIATVALAGAAGTAAADPLSQMASGTQTFTASGLRTGSYEFTGNLGSGGTPVGAGSVTISETLGSLAPYCGPAGGSSVFTESGTGATLTLALSGTDCPSGSDRTFTAAYTVGSGTGRFAGATGSGTVTLHGPTQTAGAATASWSGTIILPTSQAADLTVTLSAAGRVDQHGTIDYALTIANAGPAGATGVLLSQELPAGVTYLNASPSCGQAGTTVLCGIGNVPKGASGTLHVLVSADAVGAVSSTAHISSNLSDPNQANNSATATTLIDGAPLEFGAQDLYTLGPAHTVPVAVQGAAAQHPVSIAVTGAARADFLVANQDCAGRAAGPSFSCAIDLRFSPGALGARSATLNVELGDGSTVTVPLSGSGVSPVAGSQPGPAGPTGVAGPAGPPGPQGPAGPPGRDATVSCKAGVLNVVCDVVFSSSSRSVRSVRASLTRSGATYAAVTRASGSKKLRLTLRRIRRLRTGSYVLKLVQRDANGKIVAVQRGPLRVVKKARHSAKVTLKAR